jgi:hypothetical protein
VKADINELLVIAGIVPDNIIDGLRGQKLHPPVTESDQNNALIRQGSLVSLLTPSSSPLPKE